MAIKIACGQIEIIAGRPDLNTNKILQIIDQAKKESVDIIVFPEMTVPGYMIGDLWDQTSFLKDCESYGNRLETQKQRRSNPKI